MREILFRGKRIDNGKWVQGYLFQIWDDAFILWGTTNDVPNMIKVIPETVGQYTGLKDKNGKKIFEGDIVRYIYEPGKGFWNANQLSVIRWGKTGYTMDGIFGTNKYACMSGQLCTIPFDQESTNIQEFEVIGNIHDNPELICEHKDTKGE